MATLLAALAISLVAAPLAAEAQQAKRPYRIGVLHTGFFEEIPSVAGLKAGLKALGLEEGRDVTFDIRFTRGKLDEAPTVAASLVKTDPDLLVAQQEHAARALKAATLKVPVVFVEVGDPLAADLVASVPRPGGNVTGVSSLATELTPKRLEILKATFPGVRRVWAVYHADDLSSGAAARKAHEVGRCAKAGGGGTGGPDARGTREPPQDAAFGRWLAVAPRARPEHPWRDLGSGVDEQVARPILQHILGSGRCPRVVRLRPACRGGPGRPTRRQNPARGAAPGSAGRGCESGSSWPST